MIETGLPAVFLVNSYGAFGGVNKERYELIIEGFDGHEW